MDETASANEGRGRLVLWSSLYGIWLGIAGDVLIDVNDSRSAVVLPMVALGATLTTALVVTSNHPVTTGQAWVIITGLDYATVNGALWGGAAGLSAKGTVGVALGTSAAATSVGVWVAATQRPKAGDIELVRSSLLWGGQPGCSAPPLSVRPAPARAQPGRQVPWRWTWAWSPGSAWPTPSTSRETGCS